MSSVAPTRHDYREQAARYDRTRGASPSILGPLRHAIASGSGSSLLDVAGGTGNYAEALRELGHEPCVVDVSPHMLERAAAKGLPVLRASASALPFADSSFDAVINVSALHLIPQWRFALAEARRVVRPGGRLGLMAYTRENLDVHWIFEYFPSTREWVYAEHQTLAELLEELPGARAEPIEFGDLVDASMAALCRHPRLLLDPEWWQQTSFFERLKASDPSGLADGLMRLKRDLDGGRRPDHEVEELRHRYGDGTVLAWEAPLNE